ncbi:MAG: LytTR family DNA-binding domain-containing protein [Tannerella sp.]|jgi:DNA-binding LytR/AlgR family response regulator|nr:LytTR family DNA-binding domain-containing protein [Tannerella sp.]
MINCIVVDDTPLAVEKLENFIRQVPLLRHLQSFNNGLEAITYIKTHPVDLIFLDIQMEQFTGLQFLEALQTRPKIVIVSAYSQYAVQGFDQNVTDYLLKPYSFERFLKAVDKAQDGLQVKAAYMFVKTEYRMERVDFADILYIEGQSAYLRIITRHTKIMTLQSFQQMEQILPAVNFVRVHKSYIVAIDKIESIERNIIRIGEQRIPVGRNYQDDFYHRLSIR